MHSAASGFERIQDVHLQPRHVREIARFEGQAIDPGRRGQERVDDRNRSIRAHPAPLLGNSSTDRQNAIAEARHHVCKPCLERLGLSGILTAPQFHPFADFAQRQ